MPAEPSCADEKRRLRAELRAFRRALDASALARAAAGVRDAAARLATLAAARTVAGYAASDGEIDVAPVLAAARARGATILLPRRRRGATLELVPVPADLVLQVVRGAGVMEPDGDAADLATLATPAVVLTPAVALDRAGGRLGRGGGDYDRLLPVLRAHGWTIVGVCHAAQLQERLPLEAHDSPVDAILTEDGLVVPAR